MLSINENTNKFDKESVKVTFVRVEYDVEKAARGVEESGLPLHFASMLRKAY